MTPVAFLKGLPLLRGESWGYIDEEGRFVISPRFDDAHPFSAGRAVVKKNRKYLSIDKSSEVIFRYGNKSPLGHWPNDPQGELQPAKDASGDLLLINAQGEAVIQLEDFTPEHGGIFSFKKNDRWGLMDYKGNTLIPPSFKDSLHFYEGISAVEAESGKHGFIDMKGRFVIGPQFADAKAFSEGVAAVRF